MGGKVDKLRDFLLQHLDELTRDGGSGSYPILPEFDLYAQDYLQFAEFELEQYQLSDNKQWRTCHLINCLANLKRALENQLDTFIHAINLRHLLPRPNAGVPAKLELVSACGILSEQTLTRINHIRNAIEYEYKVPKLQDIESFYDLVSGAVNILQQGLLTALESELEFIVGKHNETGSFTIRYDCSVPQAEAAWVLNGQEQCVSCDGTDRECLLYLIRVIYLLRQLGCFGDVS
jgi:hypothetical protein